MRMKWIFRDIGVISVFRYVFAVDLHHRDHKKTKRKGCQKWQPLLFVLKGSDCNYIM